MATNGTSQRTSSGSGSDINGAGVPANTTSEKVKKSAPPKLKKALPKSNSTGSFKEIDPGNTESVNGLSSASHQVRPTEMNGNEDPEQSASVMASPSQNDSDSVNCKHCKKSVLKTVAAVHAKACLKEKQDRLKKKREAREAVAREKEAKEKEVKEAAEAAEKPKDAVAEEESKPHADSEAIDGQGGEKTKSAKKNAVKATAKGAEEGPKKSKKRKADGDAEKAPKPKKKKEEPKPKVPKPKGPVDVEKHCGVPLPNGGQCARSLTCKSHSMGAKRAVPGRSLPYDMLLHAYQKKNQAKQQKAAIDANAPLQDELDGTAGPIDSDEEKDAIMAAIARSRPQPLEKNIMVPTKTKYQYIRMKEMLSNALGGSRGSGLFAVDESSARSAV